MISGKKYLLIDYFFKGTVQYSVPPYQRGYTWNRKQCQLLFDDILNLSKSKNTVSEHFLGTFVELDLRKNNKDKKKFNHPIIDGQQRITTIYLLMKAIYDLCDSKGNCSSIKKELNNYLFNPSDINSLDNSFKVKLKDMHDGTNESDFKNIMNNTNTASKGKLSAILINYNFFHESLSKLDKAPFKKFYIALKRISCVVIVLKNEDNPQLVFDRINSTGTPLSLEDEIRNYLLMISNDNNHLYSTYWQPMEKELNSVQNGKNNLRDFLWNYIQYKTKEKKKPTTATVYNYFKDITKYPEFNGEEEKILSDLCKYSQYYYFFIEPKNKLKDVDSDILQLKDLISSFGDLGTYMLYPFYFSIFNDADTIESIHIKTLIDTLKFTLNFLIRRFIMEVPTNTLGDFFKKFHGNIFNDIVPSGDNYLSSLYDYVSKLTDKNKMITDSEELKTKLETMDLYNANHGQLCKYILSRYEMKKHGKEIVFKLDSVSIEHIMPQDLSHEWRQMLIDSGSTDPSKTHETYKHTLGNLSLIDKGFNSGMRNESFDKKKSDCYSSSAKNHTAFTFLYEDVNNATSWGEKEINQRAKKLADFFVDEILKLPDDYLKIINKNEESVNNGYTLASQESFAHLHPISFILGNNSEVMVNGKMADLFIKVCSTLYNIDKEKTYELAKGEEQLENGGTNPFSTNIGESKSQKFKQINSGDETYPPIYVQYHQSNDDAKTTLINIFPSFGLKPKDLIIYVK